MCCVSVWVNEWVSISYTVNTEGCDCHQAPCRRTSHMCISVAAKSWCVSAETSLESWNCNSGILRVCVCKRMSGLSQHCHILPPSWCRAVTSTYIITEVYISTYRQNMYTHTPAWAHTPLEHTHHWSTQTFECGAHEGSTSCWATSAPPPPHCNSCSSFICHAFHCRLSPLPFIVALSGESLKLCVGWGGVRNRLNLTQSIPESLTVRYRHYFSFPLNERALYTLSTEYKECFKVKARYIVYGVMHCYGLFLKLSKEDLVVWRPSGVVWSGSNWV